MNKRRIGNEGEKVALIYLESKGLKIIETNYRCKIGEIDIIARDYNTVVFIEVKYRKDIKMGRPYESVNYFKQNKIIKSAVWYAMEKNIYEMPMRFDVLEIIGEDIHWIKNAFIIESGATFI